MTSATDRYKMLLANALERVCVLEAALEERDAVIADFDAEIVDLRAQLAERNGHREPVER